MMRRITVLSLLALLLPVAAAAQFVIVTRTGAQIPSRVEPRIDKNLVRFQSMQGTPLVMNILNMDVEATERVNGVELPMKVERMQARRAADQEPAGPRFFGITIPANQPANGGDGAVTYTNADLKNIRSRRPIFAEAGSELPQVAQSGEAQRVERPSGTAPELNREEWQTRAQSIKNRQREVAGRRDVLRSEAQQIRRGMAGLDASRTQRLGRELDRINTQLRASERELSQLSRQWEQLQEEARRAGVPNSWIQ